MDGDFCFSLALPETRCGSPSSPLPLSIPSSAAAFAHALDWTGHWIGLRPALTARLMS